MLAVDEAKAQTSSEVKVTAATALIDALKPEVVMMLMLVLPDCVISIFRYSSLRPDRHLPAAEPWCAR